ncbi:helix-turn-helix domain-containing protein [Streptococcus himalayensis]|uniref:HTH cro/C1-type domain-containing protein n=1 Tax=Streptococcus himalayensis TaxID=1888195 RepID=A0A917A603_9STRE|nr:helix-turn-helix domain-containing protein [Streptococcus himalayensis]GGE25304.1 hypothetical protein GCM10011510_02990 [Streptococcus himalayensis]
MIGKKLKNIRNELSISLSQISKEIDVSRSYISDVENEKKISSYPVFIKVIDFLSKVSPINEKNKDLFLTEKLYNEWKENCQFNLSDDSNFEGYYELWAPDGFIITMLSDTDKEDEQLIDEKKRDFFFQKSFLPDGRDGDYKNTNERYIPIYQAIDGMDYQVQQWWKMHYFQDMVLSVLDSNETLGDKEARLFAIIQNELASLNSGSRQGEFLSFTHSISPNKEYSLDLSSLLSSNMKLTLRGSYLSDEEHTFLKTVVEGMIARRKELDK